MGGGGEWRGGIEGGRLWSVNRAEYLIATQEIQIRDDRAGRASETYQENILEEKKKYNFLMFVHTRVC